jgi:hypothetical protein
MHVFKTSLAIDVDGFEPFSVRRVLFVIVCTVYIFGLAVLVALVSGASVWEALSFAMLLRTRDAGGVLGSVGEARYALPIAYVLPLVFLIAPLKRR